MALFGKSNEIKQLRNQVDELVDQISYITVKCNEKMNYLNLQVEELKTMLGIKNFRKTQTEKQLFLDSGLLPELLNGYKSAHYRLRKLEKK